jgi:hypothetical protein
MGRKAGVFMNKMLGLFAGVALGALIAVPAAAQPAVGGSGGAPASLLGVFNNWSAFQTGSGSSLTGYALSKPRAVRPKGAKRGDIYLMVSTWPARKVRAETQVVLGYPGNEKGAASLGIGGSKFNFFIRNTGGQASAWLDKLDENARMIDAMKAGVSAVATGISQRGTRTTDTYSLSGFNDALAKIQSSCPI